MRALQRSVVAGFTLLALTAFAPAASADVQLSIRDGRVTIVARDATVRQILTEWARVGRTKIVNVERIPGGPLTLELRDVPELDALDVLLRTLSGYMAAPRTAAATPDASQFDAIIVMPTTAPPPSRTASASVMPAPFAPPSGFPQVDDDQGPPQTGQPRGPIFNTFPQPQVAPPQQRPNVPAFRPGIPQPLPDSGPQPVQPPIAYPPSPAPGAQPTSPFGAVTTPGMIAAPAQQPGQIAQPRRQNEN